ncbi:MAG: hypothetical protein EA397_01100 [Deltaproteobacteria bacterium]|nr:MAG: hypothetical protein EA397_01100 [Deltaproteobacteria bacterium]
MRTAMLLTLPLVLAASCTPKTQAPEGVGPTVVAPQNLFLRNAFDADPTMYLGRFVPDSDEPIDESSAMQLPCSQHISYRKIDGGGVVYDEMFNASTEAAARVGVPLIANASIGASASQVVRVRYELTDKLVADIQDPAAFEACCSRAPDQCTERFIGEFIGGTGSVFYSSGQSAGAKGSGVSPSGGSGDLEFRHGMAWQRSIEFPRPIYFAFKTSRNQFTGQQVEGGCGPWTNAPPRSSQGRYFVGISMPMPTQMEARDTALRNGREQVIRYIAEGIDSGSLSVRVTQGLSNALQTQVEDARVVETAASGVARLVGDEAWCVEPTATPGGNVYVAKVLMFFPRAQEEAAIRAFADAAGIEAPENEIERGPRNEAPPDPTPGRDRTPSETSPQPSGDRGGRTTTRGGGR